MMFWKIITCIYCYCANCFCIMETLVIKNGIILRIAENINYVIKYWKLLSSLEYMILQTVRSLENTCMKGG